MKNLFFFVSLSTLSSLLARAIMPLPSEEDYMAEGYDAELDRLRALALGGKTELAHMCEREKQKTGLSLLKIKYNNVFGYFFELPLSQKDKAPEYFIRKQTLSTGERFVTEELKNFEHQVLSAQTLLIQRQAQLYAELQTTVLSHLQPLKKLAKKIAEGDILIGNATIAEKKRLTRPKIFSHSRSVVIEGGRHLVVEAFLEKQKKRFIPNSLSFPLKECFHLITGPNMAGKSTYLRQNALIVFLAHVGFFVPAEKAEIPLIDALFTRIGSGDSLSTGESTFLVEMQETARILRHSSEHSFVILDEIGRGTSTYDGLSIAWAVCEHLHEKQCKTLFATHYHELIRLVDRLPFAKNFSARILEDAKNGVIFLHQIFEGGATKSFGIEVGKLAGLPHSVLQKAQSILAMLEQKDTNPLDRGAQVSLFEMYAAPQPSLLPAEAQESEIEKELKTIDPNHLTPMEALKMVNGWKSKITNS